jgi:ribosomal protein S18 acetylase RimI-like enzyme
MQPVVRFATLSDAVLLSSLNADVQVLHAQAAPWLFKPPGPDAFTPAVASALLAKPDNLVFIASIGSEPAGYAHAEILHRAETPFCYAYEEVHLHAISVPPAWHRRGVGKSLIEAVRREAGRRGIPLLTLGVWSFNAAARAFFREQGFGPYMERMWNRPGAV